MINPWDGWMDGWIMMIVRTAEAEWSFGAEKNKYSICRAVFGPLGWVPYSIYMQPIIYL